MKKKDKYPTFYVGGETYDGEPIFKEFSGKNAYNKAIKYRKSLKHRTDIQNLTKIIRDETQ